MIGGSVIVNALWLSKIFNCVNHLPSLEIDHFESVVFDSSHEKSLTPYVNTEMINASFDVWQRNVRLQRKDRRFLCERIPRTQQRDQNEQWQANFAPTTHHGNHFG